MTCAHFDTAIDDYVDGSLDAGAGAALEAHLERCHACRALVDDLRALRAATRSLDPVVPSPRVWMRIAAAVDADRRKRSLFGRFELAGLEWRPILSTAAVVIVLAGGIWASYRDVSSASARRAARVAAADTTPAPVVSPIQPVGTTLDAAEQHYTNAIATLEQITKSGTDDLDPPTARIVQSNLAVIDQAIGESRQALQQEPASNVAQESLLDALRSKIGLLQDTIALINEMRKGNQEGAARIVSGMNQ
jgi:hypothetical protein